ncbi:KGG domain-containing protein [Mucilaginibacter pineti]|uniref:KGG domain-containing protein n=1 Tax=Mucilaginibacter pineti TaxID=1391627 RepID=UPI000B84D429|nr:KGG domain-containing protein [Mucilaginibacter pineti]
MTLLQRNSKTATKKKKQGLQNRGNQQEGSLQNRGRNDQESQDQSDDNNSSNHGFASMDDDQQREIASKAGKAVSKDKEHMAEIGRKGGQH